MQRRYAGSVSVVGLMFILCLLAPPITQAADYYVARNGANTHTPPYTNWGIASSNIQNAVNAAAEFDTIWIGSGTYTVPTNAVEHIGTNVVYMDKLLNLIGASGDPADTIIDGEGAYRGMAIVRSAYFETPLVMEALTIRNCFATNWGGGIYFDNGNTAWPCIMRNCVITSNTVSSPESATGGGIYASSTASAWSLSMSNCVLRGNIATNTVNAGLAAAGAAYLRCTGLKEFVNCIIEDNRAGGRDVSSALDRPQRVTREATNFPQGGFGVPIVRHVGAEDTLRSYGAKRSGRRIAQRCVCGCTQHELCA